jgi:DNA-binding CsgD family transcriptional regulator
MDAAATTDLLLERSAELARIESALAESRAGRGRFLVIEGSPGIGKTALLVEARTAAAESGMRVLRARGTELERDFAFGVVRQLFEPPLVEASHREHAELLQGAAGVAAGLLGLPGAPPRDGPQTSVVDPSFAIFHGLYWLCANLTAAGPLCLLVDDAQWADAASLRYLAFLLTRLEELDVALVAATRSRDAGTDRELLARVTTDPSADVIRLRPLTKAAVAELLGARLGVAPDTGVVDTCLRVTRGVPFLVRELAEALGAGEIESGVQTVGRSVALRLGRLPEPAGRLARALAVLEQGDLYHAARLAGLEEPDAADAADLLATAGILEPGRPLSFVHPLVRDGVYAELSSAERAQGHRRAAELFAEQPGASARVAEHLLVSEPAADDWVVERLVEAARGAGKQGAPETQAVLLRRALAEPPAPGHQSPLLLDLGMAEASAGLADWQEHLQGALDTAPDAAAASDAAMVLAHALSRAQRFGEAVEVLDHASSALDAGQSDIALLLAAAAIAPAMNDPATAPSVSHRRERLRELTAGQTAPGELPVAVAAFVSVLMNEPAEVGAELAGRALVAGSTTAAVAAGRPRFSFTTWFSLTSFSLLWTERYDQLRPLLDASIAQARVTGDSSRLAVGLATRGWLAHRRGDLCAAEGDTRTALAATALPAPPMYRVLNCSVLVGTLVDRGELAAAEQALAPLDSEAERGSAIAAELRFARGRLRVAQAKVAEGLEDLLAVGALLTRALISCPGYLPWRSEAALASLRLGDRESAIRLATEELELAEVFGAPRALGVARRAAGIAAGGERGASYLRRAIADFERAEAGLEHARTLADLGASLRRRNHRVEARKLLRQALDDAHHAGAGPLADYAETELRATGARPRRVVLRGLDSLTASERRIAEFASQGLSNREIAQALFVTARTVEGHLTSVFRKLQIDSRDQLAAALGLGAPAGT